jgi:hypothetical protein
MRLGPFLGEKLCRIPFTIETGFRLRSVCFLIQSFRSSLEPCQSACDSIVKLSAAEMFHDPSPPSR